MGKLCVNEVCRGYYLMEGLLYYYSFVFIFAELDGGDNKQRTSYNREGNGWCISRMMPAKQQLNQTRVCYSCIHTYKQPQELTKIQFCSNLAGYEIPIHILNPGHSSYSGDAHFVSPSRLIMTLRTPINTSGMFIILNHFTGKHMEILPCIVQSTSYRE